MQPQLSSSHLSLPHPYVRLHLHQCHDRRSRFRSTLARCGYQYPLCHHHCLLPYRPELYLYRPVDRDILAFTMSARPSHNRQ